jgi:hypothetical protein
MGSTICYVLDKVVMAARDSELGKARPTYLSKGAMDTTDEGREIGGVGSALEPRNRSDHHLDFHSRIFDTDPGAESNYSLQRGCDEITHTLNARPPISRNPEIRSRGPRPLPPTSSSAQHRLVQRPGPRAVPERSAMSTSNTTTSVCVGSQPWFEVISTANPSRILIYLRHSPGEARE